ncbi:4Fe-4S dicluster domain-containing protein [Candidatus Pacearchaeota archaeon]|nr:4Fe-4S dicluster domain-containing protein [Candidatus Pacearchaeota archaeon]
MSVESENAKEEINEIVERCIRCGLCKNLCPVLKVMHEEQYGPRGKAIILDNKHIERIVFDCTLCKACEHKCPYKLKLCKAFVNARKIIVAQKKDPLQNRELIRNLSKTGNIYAISEE